MKDSLKGKVALVTGGGSGIGQATAQLFAREGAKVVVSDIDHESGEEMVRLIKVVGGEALFIKADVSKASDVEQLVKHTLDSYQGLHCACNNAGVGSQPGLQGTVSYIEEDWNRTMNVNLKGVWLCMKYEIPHMLKYGGGAFVYVSSFAGLSASKLGIVAY